MASIGSVPMTSPLRKTVTEIADVEDFAEPVRDVEDGVALRLQPPQRRKDMTDLVIRQGRRRLVEDEDARPPRQQAGDLDELALADAELVNLDVEIEAVQSDEVERLARSLPQRPAPME